MHFLGGGEGVKKGEGFGNTRQVWGWEKEQEVLTPPGRLWNRRLVLTSNLEEEKGARRHANTFRSTNWRFRRLDGRGVERGERGSLFSQFHCSSDKKANAYTTLRRIISQAAGSSFRNTQARWAYARRPIFTRSVRAPPRNRSPTSIDPKKGEHCPSRI